MCEALLEGGDGMWICAQCKTLIFACEEVRINKGPIQHFCMPPTDGTKSCARKRADALGTRVWRYELVVVIS